MKFIKIDCPTEIDLGKTNSIDQKLVINRSLNLATLEEIIHEAIAARSTNLYCNEINGQKMILSYAVNFIEEKTSRPVLDITEVKRLIIAPLGQTKVDRILLYSASTGSISFVPHLNENSETNTTIFFISFALTDFGDKLRQWLEESWDTIMSKISE